VMWRELLLLLLLMCTTLMRIWTSAYLQCTSCRMFLFWSVFVLLLCFLSMWV
jgi:hypothetical protein